MIHIWRPWKLSNFQDPPPHLSIYVQNSSTPLTLDVQFQTTPLLPKWYRACERMKSKQKQNQVKSHSNWQRVLFFGLAPQTISLKDYFTVWRQREDFLSIILIFGLAWCLIMAQTQFSLIKKKDWTPRTLATPPPPPPRPIASHFCLKTHPL